jgi:hypothetical protein
MEGEVGMLFFSDKFYIRMFYASGFQTALWEPSSYKCCLWDHPNCKGKDKGLRSKKVGF